MHPKEELRQMLLDVALKFNENGNTIVIDTREVLLSNRGARLVAGLIEEKLKSFKSSYVGGMTLAATLMASAQGFKGKHSFMIRYERKAEGLQKLIEGDFRQGVSVVILDDFIRPQGLIFDAIRKVEEEGAKVEGVISIFNRDNGDVALKNLGYKAEYLFDMEEICLRVHAESEPAEIVWQVDGVNEWGAAVPHSSPAKYKSSVIVGTNEAKMLSIDSDTGKIIWKFQVSTTNPKGILSSPKVQDDKVYFGAYDGSIYCLHAATGKPIWKKRCFEWIGSSPEIHEGVLYIGTEYGQKGGGLAALDAMDGTLLWHFETDNYVHCSPGADKESKIVMIGSNDRNVYAVKDGKMLWKKYIGAETKAGFAVENGLAYFGSHDGVLRCMDIKSGKLTWQKKLGLCIYSKPEIIGENIIISTVSKRVFCLNKNDASIRWFYNTEGDCYSSTMTMDSNVYFGCSSGMLYCLDMSGSLLSKVELCADVLSRPLLMDDGAILACRGKVVKINKNIYKPLKEKN